MTANTYKSERFLETGILESGKSRMLEIPNAGKIIQFKLTSKEGSLKKFDDWTRSGVIYRGEDALEYLETVAHQMVGARNFVKQGHCQNIKLGQFLTTYKQLEYQFNWTAKKTRYWLAQWQKQGVISTLAIVCTDKRKIGTLITCNRLLEFRNQLSPQFEIAKENQKKLRQKWGELKADTYQYKNRVGANKEIENKTYKNNIENPTKNSLTFEANQKLWDFNKLILAEKKEQEAELLILRKLQRDEGKEKRDKKTKEKQLKRQARFEAKKKYETGIETKEEIKSDTVKISWDWQDTEEFKNVKARLEKLGFERYAINGLWWRFKGQIPKLLDYIEYVELKIGQGKVNEPKKFLYHALNAKYDIGELVKLRLAAISKEEKMRLEEEQRAEERRLRDLEYQDRLDREERNKAEVAMVRAWVRDNQDSEIFEELLDTMEQTNKFMFTRMTASARRHEFRNVGEFIRSEKISDWDLGLSGVWERVKEIVEGTESVQIERCLEENIYKSELSKCLN